MHRERISTNKATQVHIGSVDVPNERVGSYICKLLLWKFGRRNILFRRLMQLMQHPYCVRDERKSPGATSVTLCKSPDVLPCDTKTLQPNPNSLHSRPAGIAIAGPTQSPANSRLEALGWFGPWFVIAGCHNTKKIHGLAKTVVVVIKLKHVDFSL